ncbi:thioredoxin family protein [Bacteroidota bacterium]
MDKIFAENNEEKYLQEILSSNIPVMLEVRSGCCGNSYLADMIFRKIENDFNNNIRIARIDYESHKDLLMGIEIESFPIVLLMKSGIVCKRVSGTISRRNLQILANELLERTNSLNDHDK